MSQALKYHLNPDAYLPHQWEYLTSHSTRLCLAAGYGAGKTFTFLRKCLLSHLQLKQTETGKSNGWVIYPTYDLSEELFIEPFCELLDKLFIEYDYNISKHRLDTQYGRIRIFSLQNPQRIVGGNLTWVGVDEMDVEQTRKVMAMYNKAIARLRGCPNAPFFTVSTLEGYKAVYDIFFNNPTGDKHLIQASTVDNPYLPAGYVDSLMADYDELMQEMYIHGRPVNLNGSAAYYTFKRDQHVQPCKDMDDGNMPLWLGIDFNVQPMTASLSVLVKGVSYTFAEYHLRVGNTRMLCELVRQDYPDRYVLACPDMTGDARRTSAERTDIDILKSFNFDVQGTYNLTQRDRLNIVNNIYDKQKAVIDPSCKHLIHDRERVIITDNQIDKSDDALTHVSDGNDYMLIQQFKQQRNVYIR